MIISDNKTIANIQLEFTFLFPGLKIEFYNSPHEAHETSPSSQILENNLTIGEIRNTHSTKEFRLTPKLTVSEVEETFREEFGLNAQIFRKSKNIWLQTSTTDDWTLEKQNLRAMNSMSSETNLYNDRIAQ